MSHVKSLPGSKQMLQLKTCWYGMRQRCLNPKSESYPDYGGRGIGICREWLGSFKTFRTWALLNGYSPGLEIDRRDNEKGYSPGNCRWVSGSVNSQNKRKRRGSVSSYLGVSKVGRYWQSLIQRDGNRQRLGWFTSDVAAAIAYDIAAVEIYGPDARVNFRPGKRPSISVDEHRRKGRGYSARIVAIGSDSKSIAAWGRELGVSRQRAKQLFDAGQLSSRVLESQRKATA